MDSIRVLHVDDDPDFAALVVTTLEQRDDRFEVVTDTSAADAIERLDAEGRTIDCVVSDYDMPGATGLDFLETVRESSSALPFILFTGKGSEEVASEAIAAGATDYLQKRPGSECFELLANRIENAVDQYTTRRKLERRDRRYRAVFEDPNLLIGLLDPDGTMRQTNRTALEYVEADEADLVGTPFWETPWWPDDADVRDSVREDVERAASGEYVDFEAEHETTTGDTRYVEGTIRPVTTDDGTVESLIVSARDVTDRVTRERRLERQANRFDDLASVISHDLQTPIEAARGRLKLALEMDDIEHVPKAVEALDRLDALRRDVVEVLRSGEVVNETVDFGLEGIVWDAVSGVEGVERDNLTMEGALRIEGDPGAVTRLFENLLSNTVEHAGDGVAVRVGPLADGFYYEDDGPGIEPDRREVVFEPGVSSKQETGGMGLASVQQIVDAHGWEIRIVDGMQLGGVRFEVRW